MSHTPATPASLSVLIGRFQPFHAAHLALLRRALAIAPHTVVVIGSAHQARSPRNPFTWQERAQMILQALPEADRGRVHLLPLRDLYDRTRWAQAVREGVERIAQHQGQGLAPGSEGSKGTAGTAGTAGITLVGHLKDHSSAYLNDFPGWGFDAVAAQGDTAGTQVRDTLFAAEPRGVAAMQAEVAAMATARTRLGTPPALPASTATFLHDWVAGPHAAAQAVEWRMLAEYRRAWQAAPYPPVFVTVDALVRCAGHVLLIERGKAPGRGLLALPGGFIEADETARDSALRELEEETHLDLPAATLAASLRATAVFDHPGRSLRGRTITHVHLFDLGDRPRPAARADDDAASLAWVPIAQLAGMEDRFHEDHFHILDHFLGLTSPGA